MSNDRQPCQIVITGVGMVTSIGYSASVAANSVRAGIQRFVEMEETSDREGEPVVGAPVALLVDHAAPQIEMMTMAASEAFETAFPKSETAPPPVWACITTASFWRSDDHPLGRFPLERVQESIGHVPITPPGEVRAGGHATVLGAVADAIQLLSRHSVAACLVGGVDSLIQIERLTWLDEQSRLKASYNPHGLIPGEAAAFLVLEREADARRRGAACWASVGNVGLAKEENAIGSDSPCLGAGLSQAITEATVGHSAQIQPLLGVVCDLNGEPYRANEWGIARSRALRWAREVEVLHPADCLGDVGAATGAVLLGLASVGLKRDYVPTSQLLLWAGSDDGRRAAVMLGQWKTDK